MMIVDTETHKCAYSTQSTINSKVPAQFISCMHMVRISRGQSKPTLWCAGGA